ncbi:hypothetical protein FRB93_006778 [Tulasnella sp. JGI-2019a]|nr:hypothetical protein FRB93_006778 [Tulasnella sp. JGI-2019a]
MNLRIIPAIPSQPTVIFSLNWHAPPSSLSLPHFYSSQLVSCQDFRLPVPRNPLAVDKAVGLHLLIDSVTFDLARQTVNVAWVDSRSMEWSVNESQGFRQALEDVLDCVRMSGVEAEKEKKAAAAAALAARANAPGHARSDSSPYPSSSSPSEPSSSASTSTPSKGHSRHRTASGIFSSLVASFISPPSNSSSNAAASTANPTSYFSSTRRRGSIANGQAYHRQHVFHPSNKRESLPPSNVAQSRYLRRQARAKLVDIFRYHVASRLTQKMREAGIVGEELRQRGILDDLEDGEEYEGPMPGTGGFAAAGGYVAYMARSLLRKTLSEVSKDEEESWSSGSSGDESLLLTPKDQQASLAADVPSDCVSDNASSKKTSASAPSSRSGSPAPRSTRRSSSRASTAASPQTQQIRHLSSVLIGLTQKDKRSTNDEREMMDMVKERSLRRRWSLAEASTSRKASMPPRDVDMARKEPKIQDAFGKPLVGSPLRECEVLDYFGASVEATMAVPFPAASKRSKSTPPSPTVAGVAPFDEDAADVTDSRDEIPIIHDEHMSFTTTTTKAFEAEDVDMSNSRSRCASLLPTTATTTSPPQSPIETESPEMIIKDLPAVPSTPTKRTHVKSNSCPPALMISFSPSSSETSSDDDEEMEITDASSSEEEGYALAAPVKHLATQTIYSSTHPKSPTSPTSPTFQRMTEDEQNMVRGLELELQTATARSGGRDDAATDGGIAGTFWPHVHDGIFVVG